MRPHRRNAELLRVLGQPPEITAHSGVRERFAELRHQANNLRRPMSQDGRVLMTVCRSHEDVPKARSVFLSPPRRSARRPQQDQPAACRPHCGRRLSTRNFERRDCDVATHSGPDYMIDHERADVRVWHFPANAGSGARTDFTWKVTTIFARILFLYRQDSVPAFRTQSISAFHRSLEPES